MTEFGVGRANTARIHDFLLGGALNNAWDKEAAAYLLAVDPSAADRARAHRAFLAVAVEHMLDHGIRQFLDLGAGVPTADPTHVVAQRRKPDASVVYVDNEPVTVATSHAILHTTPHATTINADLRDAHAVLNHPDSTALIDLDEPVGILAIDIWHSLSDHDDPAVILAPYIAALAPNSRLALTSRTALPAPRDAIGDAAQPIVEPGHLDTICGWLLGLHPVGPRITALRNWIGADAARSAEHDLAAIALRKSGGSGCRVGRRGCDPHWTPAWRLAPPMIHPTRHDHGQTAGRKSRQSHRHLRFHTRSGN